MEDNPTMTDENLEEKCSAPEARAQSEPVKQDDPAGEAGEAGEAEEEEQLARLVRAEVEKRLARMFPAAREAPRAGAEDSQLSSREFLRLGYGAQTPQN